VAAVGYAVPRERNGIAGMALKISRILPSLGGGGIVEARMKRAATTLPIAAKPNALMMIG
jgi:hypothetical protein